MTRREMLGMMALPAMAAERPNVVVLLADDLGWGDLSCYGNDRVKTPHLDRLAATGVRFRNFYAASAVCSPSRAAILTGRYPIRFDIRKAFTDDEAHLPVVENLAGMLKGAGYRTAHVGKWHLGGLHLKHIAARRESIPGPREHGFEHYVCQHEEQPMRGQMGKERTLFRKGGTCLLRNDERVGESDRYYSMHFTDINGDEAVRLIREYGKGKQPFFLNVWFLDPHMPYEPAPEPFWGRAEAEGISDDQRRFRSMVMHMDHKIGQILEALEETGARRNTLVFFASDNGGAYEANIGPYKGGKTDLHEGGIRVPGIFSWPARLGQGVVTEMVGHHCDVLPTVCAAVGLKAPAGVDGMNLLPAMEQKKVMARGPLFWQIDLYRQIQRHYAKPQPHATEALRMGKWKLLARDGAAVALYDVEGDAEEKVNLVEREEKVVAEMTGKLREVLAARRDRRGFGGN